MTMTHQARDDRKNRQQLDGLRRDEQAADTRPSRLTPERTHERLRRWSVAELVATARVPSDHSVGA